MSELWNKEAESLTLAAILRYPDDYYGINDVGLNSKDFVFSENKAVMKAISAVVREKKSPDFPLVLEELRVAGSNGTEEYLGKLMDLPCSVAQAHEFARTVKGLSAARALADAGAKIVETAHENRTDYESAIVEAESLIFKVKQVLPPEERGTSAADILRRMDEAPMSDSIPILFSPTLQLVTQGFQPGMFWVVGGFSSVGKSAFAVNMAIDILRNRGKIPYIMSLEMPSETYMLRFQSILSGVPQRVLRSGVSLPMDDGEGLDRAKRSLARSYLHIDDTARTIEQIRSKATRLKETKGLDVLFVDFIQNVYVKGDEFADARAVALELQNLAKDLSCTVIGFSQVSNQQAMRDADGGDENFYSFKGHGAIRDAADVGIMLRRDQAAQSSILKASIVKNRHDERPSISMLMDLKTGKIEEMLQPLYGGNDD